MEPATAVTTGPSNADIVTSSTFTDTAKNNAGSDTHEYTVAVNAAPIITTIALPNAAVSAPYSATIAATGSAPIAFTGTTGSLPDGITLSTDGLLSGQAVNPSATTFTISATNIAGTTSHEYTLTVDAASVLPVILTKSLPTAVVGVAYREMIVVTGADRLAVSGGSLPAGLTFETSTGIISDTPTAAGTETITFAASNAAGTAQQAVTLTVAAASVPASASSSGLASTGANPGVVALAAFMLIGAGLLMARLTTRRGSWRSRPRA